MSPFPGEELEVFHLEIPEDLEFPPQGLFISFIYHNSEKKVTKKLNESVLISRFSSQ